MNATKVLYLDLDGTVRRGFDELGRFVNKKEDVEVFDGVVDLMRKYKEKGWRIVGVTNQGGVATGQLSYEDMAAAIIETNRQTEQLFDKIMVCVHHPDAREKEIAEEVEKILERHISWKPTEGYESEEECGFQKGLMAEAKLLKKDLLQIIKH